jgi:hypothetical protein
MDQRNFLDVVRSQFHWRSARDPSSIPASLAKSTNASIVELAFPPSVRE